MMNARGIYHLRSQCKSTNLEIHLPRPRACEDLIGTTGRCSRHLQRFPSLAFLLVCRVMCYMQTS